MKFGENVEGYTIPVLNEREIRAAAGILFLLLYTSLMLIIFKTNFALLKYSIIVFFIDFIIRVFVNPKFAPSLILGRLIVSRQNPEYVGAAQKKVAWIIGVSLALVMFILMVVLNTYSVITGIICLLCLIFLFFESVFGICLGCLVYKWYYKEKAQYCPGEVCEVKSRQPIQHTSIAQLAILLCLAGLVVIMALFFNGLLNTVPTDLWKKF